MAAHNDKEAWHAACDTTPGKTRDPGFHGISFLERWLRSRGAELCSLAPRQTGVIRA